MATRTKAEARTCEVCGNEYDKAFQVVLPPPTARSAGGETHVFDSFECAIHALAPTCAHCGCRIIGHGMEMNSIFFCCAHCAEQYGIHEFEDRVEPERTSE